MQHAHTHTHTHTHTHLNEATQQSFPSLPSTLTINNLPLTSLKPATKYYYQCGDDAYGWSSEFYFVTPPTPSPSATTRVVAYGDMGLGQLDGSMQHWEQQPALNTTHLVTARVNKSEVDVLLHIGDIR